MNIATFLQDFREAFASSRMTQDELGKILGINQGHISRLLKGKPQIKADTMIALWPFVYGCPFPEQKAQTSAASERA